ncbi:hypothetical protein [Rhodoferax sp.]|uniref:hypothetical protein n=1 Tax=Rhodoferax sp. TaxID=50421 RepID=UPI002ACD264E|nr:hypothetical protein [Rhodoferax sp.]MDZ7919032.1 hypothetical protein [Rhodoferax sp.]
MVAIQAKKSAWKLAGLPLSLYEQLTHIPQGLEANLAGNFVGISDSATSRYPSCKPMRLQTAIASIAMLVGTAVAAQTPEQTGSEGIGYPTVAEAIASLKAKPGVEVQITKPDAWTIVNEPSGIQWSFVPSNHYANPAVVRREVKVNREGGVFIEMRALCQAEKAQCDKLIEEFKVLNESMRQSIQSRLKAGQGTK